MTLWNAYMSQKTLFSWLDVCKLICKEDSSEKVPLNQWNASHIPEPNELAPKHCKSKINTTRLARLKVISDARWAKVSGLHKKIP